MGGAGGGASPASLVVLRVILKKFQLLPAFRSTEGSASPPAEQQVLRSGHDDPAR